MRFIACLKKDIRLMTGGGLRSLLFLALPVLLTLIMAFTMRGAAAAGVSVRSFNIAVRDEDSTYMSRMLISQLENVRLFDSVIRLKEGETAPGIDSRCAAVVTIPKDFFYDLYTMKDTDVVIELNDDMPSEAAMVRSAFTSLIGILEENQRIYYGAARARYGELDSERTQALYRDYSSASAEEALGRLKYFGLSDMYSKGFDTEKLFFASSVISMLLMFIPLAMLRSVSEETDAGLSARFALAGGSPAEAILSKAVICFVMTAIPTAAILLISGAGNVSALIPALIICFLLSFCFFLFIGAVSKKPQTAQLIGNTVLLLMLALGGALLPYELLSEPFKTVSAYMLPRLILRAMQYPYLGRSVWDTVSGMLPMLGAALLFFLLSLPFLRSGRRA